MADRRFIVPFLVQRAACGPVIPRMERHARRILKPALNCPETILRGRVPIVQSSAKSRATPQNKR
jgi:hypothetical protein